MRHGDELARRRQELPGYRSRRSTSSRRTTGQKTLAELFDGRSQLLVYHFMFGFGARLDAQNARVHRTARSSPITSTASSPTSTAAG